MPLAEIAKFCTYIYKNAIMYTNYTSNNILHLGNNDKKKQGTHVIILMRSVVLIVFKSLWVKYLCILYQGHQL